MDIFILAVTFISQYADSALGMGYGTVMSPLLLLCGFSPWQIVPAILVSQLVTDIFTCVCHHRAANVDLNARSSDLRVALLMGGMSSIGVIVAVVVAVNVPKAWVSIYIGLLVCAMAVLIFAVSRRPVTLSWGKIMGVSLLAAFNKGVSGGGYGPLVMGGQILSGVHPRNAVGITAFAEALTCAVGFVIYAVMGKSIDWRLITLLLLGALPAVPLAAWSVRDMPDDRLKQYISAVILVLGIFTLIKISCGL